MIWGEYDDGLTNPSLRWTEHPYDLSMQATAILLADRRERVGYRHENTWLSPIQMWRRQRREVLVSAHITDDLDLEPFLERLEGWPHFARPPLPPMPIASEDNLGGGKGCKVRGCRKPHQAKGYCNAHYFEWKRNGVAYIECAVDGCKGERLSKGLCQMHYSRHRRRGGHLGSADTERVTKPEVCVVTDCDRTDVAAFGLCMKHYQRWRVRGKPPIETLAGPRRQRGKGVSASV